jgi:hypothetical protein
MSERARGGRMLNPLLISNIFFAPYLWVNSGEKLIHTVAIRPAPVTMKLISVAWAPRSCKNKGNNESTNARDREYIRVATKKIRNDRSIIEEPIITTY